MTSASILDGLILGGGLVLLSAVLTRLMIGAGILAIPNHRSSHRRPVPNGGGIAIVMTGYLGVFALHVSITPFQLAEKQLIGLGMASLILVVAGFLDDLGRIRSFRIKLAAQLGACGTLMAFGVVIEQLTFGSIGTVPLGFWKYPLTAIWIVGLTNMFNFMDGLDGLAAGTAVIVAVTFGLISLGQGAQFTATLCLILAAGALGFLVFNFPKARIFMGDVGSQFLGVTLAAIAVLSAEYDTSRIPMLVMPLLFFNFIFDTSFTFVRRLFAGENITQAHRSHLYQLMNQLGYSHAKVSLFHFMVAISQGMGAAVLVFGEPINPALVFLPFVLFQCVYAVLILRAIGRRKHPRLQ